MSARYSPRQRDSKNYRNFLPLFSLSLSGFSFFLFAILFSPGNAYWPRRSFIASRHGKTVQMNPLNCTCIYPLLSTEESRGTREFLSGLRILSFSSIRSFVRIGSKIKYDKRMRSK